MKILADTFTRFCRDYHMTNKYKSLRFGQAFYNHFNLQHSDFPSLEADARFYNSTDLRWTESYIHTHFIEN